MNTPEINDGGPAFPCTTGSDGGVAFSGMSLRDWFAGQALNGLLHSAAYGAELKRIFDRDSLIAEAGDVKESPQEYTARIAASLADAMIAQRNKK